MHRLRLNVVAAFALMLFVSKALLAQGVTTGSITGTVTGADGAGVNGAIVSATHQPSGTGYARQTRADGRFTITGMRVGGPYRVNIRAVGYEPQVREVTSLQLGVTTDLAIVMSRAVVRLEAVSITAETGPMSSSRTGAETTVSGEVLAAFPTIGRVITDFTRLTPQSSGSSFAGQDNRLNNISIDGSYFNNSFGLAGQPGGRTGVSPIPLDAVEQIQVSIAPYDVRQGNFVGAGVNAVTKSGTNQWSASLYNVSRDQGLVGRTVRGLVFNPGTFKFSQNGVRLSGPIIRDRLFFFANWEGDANTAPGTTFLANTGGQPIAGNTTRVLESDLKAMSAFLQSKFNYATGDYTGFNFKVPSKRIIAKIDWNASQNNKLSLRYIQLDSKSDQPVSNSSSLGSPNRRDNLNSMSFYNSGYAIMENIKSLVGEWNSQLSTNVSNNMIVGFTKNDESRETKGSFFPLVDILDAGVNYMSFGFEPFTPNNELRYKTVQFQDNLTISAGKHDLTFGVSAQQYNSENVFFPGKQSAYVYNSLADFYTDANDFLANPNRTTSPVALNLFQVRYNNVPGSTKPIQPLDVLYLGAYAQDEWRPAKGLKFTMGLRLDVPRFQNTALNNPLASAMVFRDEKGNPVSYSTSKLPDANVLVSPRFGFNWDVKGDRTTQLRGGSGVFTGSPAYVWISNQVGNNGILTGFDQLTNTKARPFNPNPDAYKPTTVTGAPAAVYELNFTDKNYKFPQVWRTNLAVDQRLPGGMVGTLEYLYSSDVNGTYYINANLPASDQNFTGADKRPRWVKTNRIVSNVSGAYVLKNQNVGWTSNISGSLEKAFLDGFYAKLAYNYGVSRNTVDAGSIASGTWQGNQMAGDPNNPGVGYSAFSPKHRWVGAVSYKKDFFGFGESSVAVIGEYRSQGNTSYTFAGDLNGDGATSNDLIYIPKNTSEMNFEAFTASGKTFSVAEQKDAWDAYIEQDAYLKKHRGEYAQRNAVFLPMYFTADLSVTQDLSRTFRGKKNSLEARLDILNFTNMMNSDWGVSNRLVSSQPLTARGADASGAVLYRLRNIGTSLMTTTFQKNAGLSDVYRMQLSLRYNFN